MAFDFPELERLDEQLSDGALPISGFRDALQAGSERLDALFSSGTDIVQLITGRARLVDGLLRRAWGRHVPEHTRTALVAVGGYGRGELHPGSDVDIMVLFHEDDAGEACPGIESLLTFLWDIGIEVGHSVRTVDDCVREASQDISVATNIMEARLLSGDQPLFEAMRERTGPTHLWPSDAFFEAKTQEQRARHLKYDDTAYNLEPNIKENPGGLRDIQMIGWVAKRHFGTETMLGLVDRGFLTEEEHHALMAGQAHLWRIRFALHSLAGRREDRLLFDHQRNLAKRLGYRDTPHSLAVEQFMQAYYRTVMELNRLNEMLLQHFQEAILLHDALGEPLIINARFQARSGYIEARNAGLFARYPLAMLEIFLLLQQHADLKGVRASTIRLIRAHRHLIDEKFRASLAARSLFMEILRQPRGITHELRRMNRYGILARYIPAFGSIVGRMQYDLFHVFTVDEHTLFLVRNLRRFALPEFAHEFPFCTAVFDNLPKPELIYLAGLFHDIAKGRDGDHSELGAVDAAEFCRLHSLSEYDSHLVSWLVRNHLLMSMTAQRKDIEDPEVVRTFAETVGDPVRLDYLYLLTVADIRATNPKRWSTWKDSLLRQLYTETRRAFARGVQQPQAQDEHIQEKQIEARRMLAESGVESAAVNQLWMSLNLDYFLNSSPDEIAWQTRIVLESTPQQRPLVLLRRFTARGSTEIFVCAQDRDNLFAHTTSLLDQLALSVVDARIQTADGNCTMNSYLVLEEDGRPVAEGHREHEILETLRAGLGAPGQHAPQVHRRLPRHLKHFRTPSRVSFEQDESHHRTILRLQTTDRPGLLSQVGQAFAACGIRVINAKIATVGAVAEDTFVITDQQDRPVTDRDVQERLRTAIVELLDSDITAETAASA